MILGVAVFGYYKEAGGIHVQSVYKSDFIAFSIIQHFFHDAVGYGMTGLSFGRVHHHAGLLVYNQQVAVLINNMDGDVLRRKIAGFFGSSYRYYVSGLRKNPAGHAFAV